MAGKCDVFRENEVAILRRAKRSMVRAMCSIGGQEEYSKADGHVGIEGSSR